MKVVKINVYRDAVDYLIEVCLNEWNDISKLDGSLLLQQYVECLCHKTTKNPDVRYQSFDQKFYKFPSYLRRGAINEAIGKVSSYKSNLANWEESDTNTRGRKPSYPKAGYVYPCMNRTDTYEAKIKVYICNTWDWIPVKLHRSDIDYINRRCSIRKKCAPTLQKRGREWFP